MKRRRIHHLVVTENGEIAGILSERDLGGPHSSGVPVGRMVRDLMTPDVVSVRPETTLSEAAKVMRARLIGCLPVMDDGQLVGIVTATDILDELGRESRSRPETRAGRKRAPFQDQLPKALKRITGRTKAPLIPAHVRVTGVNLSEESRADIRQKLGVKLGKLATSIERVTVRVEDVNGPRGGVDQRCRIKVVLSEMPSVVFEHQDPSLEVAIASALAGVERAVRKALQRRRAKPLKAVRTRARAKGV
jgi:ribosome-associated translation inhibitor RaiA